MELDSLVIHELARLGLLPHLSDGAIPAITKSLKGFTIPDDMVQQSRENFLSLDNAKKDPRLLSHYNDFITRGDSEELDLSIQSSNLSEADALEIKNQSTSGKRWKLFYDKTRSGGEAFKEIKAQLDQMTENKNKPRQNYDQLLDKKITEAAGAFNQYESPDHRREVEALRQQNLHPNK